MPSTTDAACADHCHRQVLVCVDGYDLLSLQSNLQALPEGPEGAATLDGDGFSLTDGDFDRFAFDPVHLDRHRVGSWRDLDKGDPALIDRANDNAVQEDLKAATDTNPAVAGDPQRRHRRIVATVDGPGTATLGPGVKSTDPSPPTR
jgi:hypothetical protein